MSSNKELRLTEARESLEMALKMLSRLPSDVSARELSRLQDVAGQAAQAAASLNQVVGMLLTDLETNK